MGYRSDVYIATTKEGFNKLDTHYRDELAEYALANPKFKFKNGLLDNGSLLDTPYPDEIVYELRWTKWDSWYVDSKTIMTGLEKLTTLGIPYSFTRIGEDGAIDEYNNELAPDLTDDGDGESEPIGELQTTMYAHTTIVIE